MGSGVSRKWDISFRHGALVTMSEKRRKKGGEKGTGGIDDECGWRKLVDEKYKHGEWR